jgi:hypothetical protein
VASAFFQESLNNHQLTVGQEVRKSTRSGDATLVFGDDWNSAVAFHSQRKPPAVPTWSSVPRGLILADPSRFLGGMKLGAIVLHNEDLATGESDIACSTHHSRRLSPTANWFNYRCLNLVSQLKTKPKISWAVPLAGK